MEKSWQEFYTDLMRTPEYFQWGFPFLDATITVEKGNFVVLAGRPSDGKTALALHMAYAQAKNHNVGFFSLETGRGLLFSRLISSLSGVANESIKKRNLSDLEYDLIAGSTEDSRKRRLTLIDATGWTVDRIESRVLARKFDVVYVDYLQRIEYSGSKRGTRQDEVADISRKLANMARGQKQKRLVVALSQLSRPKETGPRREPVMSDLRESGQIEQDADAIMFIWRQDESKSDAERILTLAKNKEGRLGTWDVVFRGETQRFVPELSGFKKGVGARKRTGTSKPQEPEYRQIEFRELTPAEARDCPFTQEGRDGHKQSEAAPPAGGGGAAAPGAGPAGPGAGGAPPGDGPGAGDSPADDRDLPF